MRISFFIAGIAVLAIVWGGPLPYLAGHSFTIHMLMHMGVVAVAAPLIALGIAGSRIDISPRYSLLFAALPASLLEFAVVWGWHAPMAHDFARTTLAGLVLEQGSFLAVGLILWLSCIGTLSGSSDRSAAGVFGLLFTSMHMTLLGALLALAPRPLFGHAAEHVQFLGMSAIEDQNMGGVVMLAAGGAVYMLGGLVLMARLLDAAPSRSARMRVGKR
jgi:putative membrane protein